MSKYETLCPRMTRNAIIHTILFGARIAGLVPYSVFRLHHLA